MLLFFIQSIFAKPQCSESLRNEDFVQHLDSIELDFVKADLPSIEKKLNTLEALIPCLDQRLLPEHAARYHILNGLTSWIADNEAEAKRSFSVAKRTDPNATISTHAFPQEHFIHELYAEVTPVAYIPIETKPSLGHYSFDGYLIPRRPQHAPTILQIVENDSVFASQYLVTDAPLFNYTRKTHHKTIVLGASAIAVAIGLGLQIDAQLIRQNYLRSKDMIASTPTSAWSQASQELDTLYTSHIKQYQRSLVAFGVGSGLLGISYFLEW